MGSTLSGHYPCPLVAMGTDHTLSTAHLSGLGCLGARRYRGEGSRLIFSIRGKLLYFSLFFFF